MMHRAVVVLLLFMGSLGAHAQDIDIPDPRPVQKPKKGQDWNEFDLRFTTLRFGFAMIHEYAAYAQDQNGQNQMALADVKLESQFKVRDFRVFASGRLNFDRPIIWRVAFMYDGYDRARTFRETGLLIGLPEAKGHVFIGRSKEGYSLYKV